MKIKNAILNIKRIMNEEIIKPEDGLGNDFFLFASTLMPVVNVDLLVINEKMQVLLAWRNDDHVGKGWHVPGGCVRFKETFAHRIELVAQKELGTQVEFDIKPIEVFEIISNQERGDLENQRERAHFVSIVFRCRVPVEYQINNNNLTKHESGYLRWFDIVPDDLLEVQECYRELLTKLMYS